MSIVHPLERWWLNAWPHRWYIRHRVPVFLRACPEPFRGEVLEVGAGAGWTSERILQTFPQVELTATDIDNTATARFTQLRGHYGERLKVQQADLLHLPFDRNSFDIAIALYVLHHVAQPERAVQQMLRVLRPGGLIGIIDHHLPRQTILTCLANENCTVLYSRGWHRYALWARKVYPIMYGKEQEQNK